MKLGVTTAVFLAALGCHVDASISPVELFPKDFLNAICDSEIRCIGGGITQSACQQQYGNLNDAAWKDHVKGAMNGQMKFDAAAASRCLMAARNLSCNLLQIATTLDLTSEFTMLQAGECKMVFQPE